MVDGEARAGQLAAAGPLQARLQLEAEAVRDVFAVLRLEPLRRMLPRSLMRKLTKTGEPTSLVAVPGSTVPEN